MEYEQPPLKENPNAPVWPEPAPEPAAAVAPPAARRPRKRGVRHYPLLLLAGLCCCAALILLATLAWGYAVYSSKGYVSGAGLLPLYIFLAAIFLSSCLVTALSRGGAIFPALLFSLLANLLSLLLAELSGPKLSGILIKLLLSLLSAAAGFTLTKLLIMKRRR
jgi:hypothetical protein